MRGTDRQQWDLERFFSGGSESEAYLECLQVLERDFSEMKNRLTNTTQDAPLHTNDFLALLSDLQDLLVRFQEVSAFQYCLTNQDMRDSKARMLGGRVGQLEAVCSELLALLDQMLRDMPETVWEALCDHPDAESILFPLVEIRRRAQSKMHPEQEVLAGDLAVDGFHAWQEIHSALISKISVPFECDGEVRSLTMAQVSSMMRTLDATGRKQLHKKLAQRVEQDMELFASILNHITGFRLSWYKHRGWKSVLQATLDENRISEGTLDAMFAALDAHKTPFIQYLNRKAELLGQTGLNTFDITVPVKQSNTRLPYEEAVSLLIEQHRRISPQMAAFIQRAVDDGWVDVTDRPHKRGGGFCVRFPLAKESRVFLTYTGRYHDLSCLAHELGHAYHQSHTMRVPALAQVTPLTLGETASTFSEQVVLEAAIRAAVSGDEKVALLDAKLSLNVLFLMGFEFRFRFEKALYERRQQGVLCAQELSDLMEQMQKVAFAESLESYQPYAWATYSLFYMTSESFYNFQYIFGFLFSKSLYALAMDRPDDFAVRYDAFLRDTGRMTVEDLASKHLGVDITQQEFWEQALAMCTEDVEEFLRLTV
jgi:oligoendopeptidase F